MYLHQALFLVLAAGPAPHQTGPATGSAIEFKKLMLAEWEAVGIEIRSMRMEITREHYKGLRGDPLQLDTRWTISSAFSPVGRIYGYTEEEYDEHAAVKRSINRRSLDNVKYKAELQRGKQPDSWVLVKYEESARAQIDVNQRVKCPWLACANIFLPDWVADDCFVVRGTDLVQVDSGEHVLRIEFAHNEAKRTKLGKDVVIVVTSGHIDVDPAKRYRVTGYRFAYKTKQSEGTETGAFRYADKNTLPLLVEASIEKPNVKSSAFGTGNFRETYSYKIEYNCEVPDREFRLSNYGLPEPVGVTWRKPTPTYIWLLAAAGICGALAIGLRYFVRRRVASA
jgi:hypothetical protein